MYMRVAQRLLQVLREPAGFHAKSSEVIHTLFRRPKFKSLAAPINVCNQRRDRPLDIVWSPFQHLIECSRHHRQQDEIAAFTKIVSTGTFHKFVSVADGTRRLVSAKAIIPVVFKWMPILILGCNIYKCQPIRAE